MSRLKKLAPIHPGEILLEEFLKPLGMSMNKLAEELHVPSNRITQIVEGRRSITGETALKGSRATLARRPNSGSACKKITICRSRAMSSRRKLSARFGRVIKQPKPKPLFPPPCSSSSN